MKNHTLLLLLVICVPLLFIASCKDEGITPDHVKFTFTQANTAAEIQTAMIEMNDSDSKL